MHFAAFAYVGESVREPELYFRNNVANSLALLEAMGEVGVGAIVFSSTCATYGLPETMPIAEDTPQRPVNPYGESKLMIERMLHWFGGAHGLRYAALRYFNAAGADPDGEIGEDHEPETHLIPLVLRAALGRRAAVDIFGTDYPTPDGTAIRDYIHVHDLAEAHVLALDRSAPGRRQPGAQSRHRPGLFGARGDRRGRARHRPQRSRGARRRAGLAIRRCWWPMRAGRAPVLGWTPTAVRARRHPRHRLGVARALERAALRLTG